MTYNYKSQNLVHSCILQYYGTASHSDNFYTALRFLQYWSNFRMIPPGSSSGSCNNQMRFLPLSPIRPRMQYLCSCPGSRSNRKPLCVLDTAYLWLLPHSWSDACSDQTRVKPCNYYCRNTNCRPLSSYTRLNSRMYRIRILFCCWCRSPRMHGIAPYSRSNSHNHKTRSLFQPH